MNNNENLIPMNRQPPEVRRELGRKGGLNSVQVRREKRALADVLRQMVNSPIEHNSKVVIEKLKKFGFNKQTATNAALINLQLMQIALSSSTDYKSKLKAIELIHKFVDGQKLDLTTNGNCITKEPYVIEVIDNREQIDNTLDEDV